ncbi:MAG: hypothetical protein NC418_11860, partial [Muribaculaceae bacterium]|nr:hypothetical protein [Muribaculaceae bacterium]
SQTGTVHTEVLGSGRFVFVPGDTVAARLVHEKRSVRTIYSGGDSIAPDSSEVSFYRWYTPGASLPFAVQVKRSGVEERLYLAEYHLVADAADDNREDTPSEVDRRAVLDAVDVSRSGSSLNVSFPAAQGVEVEVYIVDVPGNIYGHSSRVLGSEPVTVDISLAGLGAGRYMLVINISGEPMLTGKEMFVL